MGVRAASASVLDFLGALLLLESEGAASGAAGVGSGRSIGIAPSTAMLRHEVKVAGERMEKSGGRAGGAGESALVRGERPLRAGPPRGEGEPCIAAVEKERKEETAANECSPRFLPEQRSFNPDAFHVGTPAFADSNSQRRSCRLIAGLISTYTTPPAPPLPSPPTSDEPPRPAVPPHASLGRHLLPWLASASSRHSTRAPPLSTSEPDSAGTSSPSASPPSMLISSSSSSISCLRDIRWPSYLGSETDA